MAPTRGPLWAALLPLVLGACSPERLVAEHAICDGETCWCPDDFGNCDENPANGCETDLRYEQDHCGGCGIRCNNGFCDDRTCRSHEDFDDCNDEPADGFEAHLPTDPRHCGICGHDCLGGRCVASQCNPYHVVEPGLDVLDLAVDDAHLYLCSRLAGTIYRKPLLDGPLEPFAVDQRCGYGLATRDERVYWTVAAMLPTSFELEHWLYAAPVQGGTPELLTTTASQIWYLSVGSTYAAFEAHYRADEGGDHSDAIIAYELATGIAHELAVVSSDDDPFTWVTTHEELVYWATLIDGVDGAPDTGSLFATSSIQSQPVVIALAPGYEIFRINRFGDHLYWLERDAQHDGVDQDVLSRLVRMHHESGTPEILYTSHYEMERLLVDATGLYWTEGTPNEAGTWLYRGSPDGGPATSIADFQEIEILTMNEQAAYWYDHPGKILSVAK